MCSTAFLCSVVSLMPRRPSTGAMVACTSEKSCATGISAKSSGVLSVEASVKSFAESPRKRLASSTMAEAKSRRCSSVTTLLMRRISPPKNLGNKRNNHILSLHFHRFFQNIRRYNTLLQVHFYPKPIFFVRPRPSKQKTRLFLSKRMIFSMLFS